MKYLFFMFCVAFVKAVLLALISGYLWGDTLQATRIPLSTQSPKFEDESTDIFTPTLSASADWHSDESDNTLNLAWGDVDGDGDLDLAVGNWGQPNRLYLNIGGILSTNASWRTDESHNTYSVVWGDVDGDGDLDLAVGNDGPNQFYLNIGGILSTTASWRTDESDNTGSLAWGDVDGDGDLDLAVGNRGDPNRLYLNEGGSLSTTASWKSDRSDWTTSVVWGDVDNDGDLDLAVGNDVTSNRLYFNNGGMLSTTASWNSFESDATKSIAWGDVDNDGDLDLAVGNGFSSHGDYIDEEYPNRLYLNEGGILSYSASWYSDESDNTRNMTWVDVDQDGDLDLTVAVSRGSYRIYLNTHGKLAQTASWRSDWDNSITSIAWGDVDGDGDLDLAVGNYGKRNRLYVNENGNLATTASWHSDESDAAITSVAWGDVDGDDDFDLVIGNRDGPNRLYSNENGILSNTASWQSDESDATTSVAWGDVDGDGDLDLAVGNLNVPNRLYMSENGILSTTALWHSNESDNTTSVAWGDVDSDGDLDLAVGNSGEHNRLYFNEDGKLLTTASWNSDESYYIGDVTWGDVDNDGDLDLAVINYVENIFNVKDNPNQIHLNERGRLSTTASWNPDLLVNAQSIAWGDVDGDGDLDLAVGNHNARNWLYMNENGILSTTASWHSDESDATTSVAWGDVDGNGDLDLVVGNYGDPNRLYLNIDGKLPTTSSWQSNESNNTLSVALGDVDGDGDLDLAVGNEEGTSQLYFNEGARGEFVQTSTTTRYVSPYVQIRTPSYANFYATTHIYSGTPLSIPYTLHLPKELAIHSINFFYSLNGVGEWVPAIGTTLASHEASTRTNTLPQTIFFPLLKTENETLKLEGTFFWNAHASSFYGQSDNVVLRMVVNPQCVNSCQRSSITTQSFPLRVRGTQVRVIKEDEGSMQPISGAFVHYQNKEQSLESHPLVDARGKTYFTDRQGYLQGRGKLEVGDYLTALLPITSTKKYTVYLTSAKPTLDGLELITHTVRNQGVQPLVISEKNPLILFNLDLSLEWDAQYAREYLEQLERDLQRTSELLFDWTNGQAALGNITVYQNKERWDEADIRIHATNRLRPHATIGGIVPNLTLDTIFITNTDGISQQITHLYNPGHVEMGAVWNRYGEAGESLSEDWARTLAHELGHYLFFLYDNYLGLDADDQIIRVEDCPGVMSNPYFEINSEFHPKTDWLTNCDLTLSQAFVGRHDWATIVAHYPWLHEPDGPIDDPTQAGPRILPLAVTHIRIVEPASESTQIDVPSFKLIQLDGRRYLPSAQARAFLFQDGELVDLGTPQGENLLARSARPDDMVCVYDLGHRQNDGTAAPVTGCQTVQTSGELIPLSTPDGGWQPDVIITPQNAQTLTISVQHTTSVELPLIAQLYVDNQSTQDGASKVITTALTYDAEAQSYTGVLHLNQPVYEAYLHIFVEGNPAQGVVVDYSLDGAPVLTLSEGDVLTLSDGSVLILASGEQTPLADGDTLTFHRGQVQIRQPDGSIRVLTDGERLVLSGGATVTRDGEALPISDGTALAMGEGTVSIERPDGRFELQPGDALAMGEGTGFVFGDEQGGVVIWQLSGGALAMGEGTALAMGEGTALAMGEGTALAMGEGTVLWITNGRASIIGDSQVSLVGGGNAIYLGDGHAPIRSSDGQVSLYGRALNFEPGQFYTLQPATIIPNEPLWATSVGQGYRVTASPGAPDLNGISISMNYIGRTVDDDKEPLLTIYYWDTKLSVPREQKQWQPLHTKVDDEHNFATAKAVGPGIYMLMYSYEVTISGQGWSSFPYTPLGSRPITVALSSIDSMYELVYHYNEFEQNRFARWSVFANEPTPSWASTLRELRHGKSYLISVTHSSSVTIKFADERSPQVRAANIYLLPATYYGLVQPSDSFTPVVGDTVNAFVGDTLCGQGQIVDAHSQLGYRVIVSPDGGGQTAGCGASGRTVRLEVNDQEVMSGMAWHSDHINRVDIPSSVEAAAFDVGEVQSFRQQSPSPSVEPSPPVAQRNEPAQVDSIEQGGVIYLPFVLSQ
ncbi:MAG: VCBS repeat-containing protein [Chloroflexota bacterium]